MLDVVSTRHMFDHVDRAMAQTHRHWFFLSDPDVIRGSCEDYRAAASIDQGYVGSAFDMVDVWRQYATDVRGRALACGHLLPEEDADATLGALRDFLSVVDAGPC